MKFFVAVATLALSTVFADATTVSYDETYDDAGFSLNNVACSDGSNGLERFGYSTLGDLPDFPYIGGASAIPGYNSPNCGTCWTLTYQGKSITVLAVDHTDDGFNISLEALNDLTSGQAVHDGSVDATAVQVDASQCGLP